MNTLYNTSLAQKIFSFLKKLSFIPMSKSSNSIPNELQETWDDYNAARDACFK